MADEVVPKKENPRVFISYSWTSPTHESWVLRFATELRNEGIDIILDKWDLKEGDDKYAFMERMVADPTVKKVLVISDKKYAEKADKRKGGVGDEAQIISPEIYGKAKQDRFIPIVVEFDEKGTECLPTFMKGRKYIDLSNTAKYSENYDQVLRAILDKPLYQKPELGAIPQRIFTESKIHLSTQPKYRACVDAIKQGKPTVVSLLKEYFTELVRLWETFRIANPEDPNVPFDERVIASIKEFLPVRDEIIDLLHVLFVYRDEKEDYEQIHSFLEKIVEYREPKSAGRWNNMWADNYLFINYEMFLYIIALLLKHERFARMDVFLKEPYFVKTIYNHRGDYETFTIFYGNCNSLNEVRNNRLQLRRMSIVADLIKERTIHPEISFEQIMLADYVILLRSFLDNERDVRWYPQTLVYAGRSGGFELFARAASKKWFEKIKILLNVKSKEDLVKRIEEAKTKHEVRQWQVSFDTAGLINDLLNIEKLDTI